MNITSSLFEAYLKCPTKCSLGSLSETGTRNTYADWVRDQNESYRSAGIKRLMGKYSTGECLVRPIDVGSLKTSQWRLATDIVVRSNDLESTLHAIEQIPSEELGKPAQFVPIRFVFNNNLNTDDKLLLAFDALVLSQMLGSDVDLGKIIHGDDYSASRVKTSALASKIKKLVGNMATLLSTNSPPDLILNRHCAECEFKARCRQKAVERDDLSLLSGMTEKERKKQRSRGIFTVTQFSHTFRLRRPPKRAKNPAHPRHLALQALSIRENKVHIHGDPRLPDSTSRVYFDIEGLPDNEFYYLIGALIVTNGEETYFSFWADRKSDEPLIFAQFIECICQLPDFRVLHYGKYEAVALKRIKSKLPGPLQPMVDAILGRAINVLSIVHPHIYFPTYTNGLKDIGRFLGYKRTDETASGLQTIAWRNQWEASGAADIKAALLRYNEDDCRALKHLCEFIGHLSLANPAAIPTLPPITRTEEMRKDHHSHWEIFRPRNFALDDFKHINECAYFDYQREKVFVRTHRQFKIINKQRRKLRRTETRPNKIIEIECKQCPKCRAKIIEKIKQMSRLVVDLKFSRTGVKKWIIKFRSYQYKCQKCGRTFHSEKRTRGEWQLQLGHGLMSWCVYHSLFCGTNMNQTRIALGDTFEIFLGGDQMIRSRHRMAEAYKHLYNEIIQSLLKGKFIHADETTVNLKSIKGYVWVLTGIDKAFYFYKPSREAAFLKDMLRPFGGVLLSDFYTGYDSLPCPQQKCLVHFIRDIDDDLLKNPLDNELKGIAQEFGVLVRAIIETVDRHGLQSQHLRKHKPAVMQFLEMMASKDFSSELANKYKKRFQKSGAKMFTFLDHEGVPWNNNTAEHAIKRFAKFRRYSDGRFSEESLHEYLILASIFETCALNNVNVLKFFLSKETTLAGLFRFAGHKQNEDDRTGSNVQNVVRASIPYGQRHAEIPKEARIADAQARYFARTGQFRKAAQSYIRAIGLAPGWPTVRFNAAVALAKFSAHEDAIFQMRCYLKFCPHASDADDAREKIKKWKAQMSGSPGDLIPHGRRHAEIPIEARKAARLGRQYACMGKFKNAAKAFARAILTAPGWPAVRFNYAMALAKLAAYGEAVEQMKCYLKLWPRAFNEQIAKDRIAEWETRVPDSTYNALTNHSSSNSHQKSHMKEPGSTNGKP